MSPQTQFFMTPKDTDEAEQRLRKVGPLTILHGLSMSPVPRVLDSLNFTEDGKRWWSLYLARPEDIGNVAPRFVPVQNYWTLGGSEAPTIEFDRSSIDGKILRRGRLYYETGFYDDAGVWITKSAEFLAWAKKINAALKKGLKRHGTEYIGTDALAWLDASGGKLVDFVLANKERP